MIWIVARESTRGQSASWRWSGQRKSGWLDAAEGAGQPWAATTWSLTTRGEWGLSAEALAGTAAKLAANSRWEYEHRPNWDGEVDCCINAMTLANGAWLGADITDLAVVPRSPTAGGRQSSTVLRFDEGGNGRPSG